MDYHPNGKRYINFVNDGSLDKMLPANTDDTVDFFNTIVS